MGNAGDATKGTAEKGELMANALVGCIADAIKNLDEMNWDYSSSAVRIKPK